MTDAPVPSCAVCGRTDCDCDPDVVAEAVARAEAGQEPLVIASDPAQAARRKRDQKAADKQESADLNWLMRHPQGRRIMWQLLETCGVYRNPAFEGGFSTNETFFKAGQQNIGQFYLQRTVSKEPDGYNLMVKENSGRLSA